MRNGWMGTMYDNMRGDTRMVRVEGFETEIGSVYSHDIKYVFDVLGNRAPIEYTKNQLELRELVDLEYAKCGM